MMKNNHTKSAVVMGATSGIGYEVALLLAQRGWQVGVAGRREEILSQLVKQQPGIVAYEVIDVISPQATEGLQRLIAKLGQMDLYFHSSGIGLSVKIQNGKDIVPASGETINGANVKIKTFFIMAFPVLL